MTVAAAIGFCPVPMTLAAHIPATWLNRPTLTRKIELDSGAYSWS